MQTIILILEVATWNARSARREVKFENIERETEIMRISIQMLMKLDEIEKGKETLGKFIQSIKLN